MNKAAMLCPEIGVCDVMNKAGMLCLEVGVCDVMNKAVMCGSLHYVMSCHEERIFKPSQP